MCPLPSFRKSLKKAMNSESRKFEQVAFGSAALIGTNVFFSYSPRKKNTLDEH